MMGTIGGRFCALMTVVSFWAAAAPLPARAAGGGGIDHMFNSGWDLDLFGINDYLKSIARDSSVTRLSGGFANKKTGLALGVNADIEDNKIGKASRLLGYLGYKKTYLRYQSGTVNGSYRWSRACAPGMAPAGDFSNSFRHIDLLFWRKQFGTPGFLGLGYTSFSSPAQINTWHFDNAAGVPVYDLDFKVDSYSFLFGFDTFAEALTGVPGGLIEKKGFAPYISAEDRFGFGKAKVSKEAAAHAEALNPGTTAVGREFFSLLIENDTSLGMQWFSPGGNVGIGLGYEVAFILNFGFGGSAKKPGELALGGSSTQMRHGPVLRLLAKW